jgi:DNA invertase Pin-like site-specific DNA recombinase
VKVGGQYTGDPNKTLHIYTRVSTSVQANEGTSLDTQQRLGETKAKQLKFVPVLWDEGGKSSHHEDMAGRPELLALFEAIKRGEVKHLWVYDQSRLSRNDNVASAFRYQCNKVGVTLYTKDGQFDLSNPQDKLMKIILDGMGEFENSIRTERTRLGKLNRARQGFWFGGPAPFGYKVVDKKLVTEKTEATWVKRIFTETLKGTSTLGIKHLLDSKGVLPRRKKGMWSIGSIQALIKNTHYKGWYQYHDKKSDEVIKIDCPAIVDETTWMAVQKLKTRDTSRVSQQNRTKQFYLLRDFMVCGHCGRPMSARRKLSKNEQLYYCPNKERDWVNNGGTNTPWKRGEGCGMERSLNIPETDDLVWKTVLEIHRKSSFLKEQVKSQILEDHGAPVHRTEQDLKMLENQIKHLQKQCEQSKNAQAELLLSYTNREIKKDVYEIALNNSKQNLHNLEVKLANLQLQLKGGGETRRWVDWLKIFGETLDNKKQLTDEERKSYLSGLVEKITVHYNPELKEHQLELKFQLPIVGDGIVWKSKDRRSDGYKLKKGKQITSVEIKKKDPRSKSVKLTP